MVAGATKPRYVRVNTLKLDVDSAILDLEKDYSVRVYPKLAKLQIGSIFHFPGFSFSIFGRSKETVWSLIC